MHYIVTWTFGPENHKSAVARFLETGAQPPNGVKMQSRWHDFAGNRGFAIVDTEEPSLVAKWCREWADLLEFEVISVLDDQQLANILQG